MKPRPSLAICSTSSVKAAASSSSAMSPTKHAASSRCRDRSHRQPARSATRSGIRLAPNAARRLFAMSRPIAGTLADRYLAGRGILLAARERALRFHPRLFLPGSRDRRDADPARADRRRHRPRRAHHRPAAHLAGVRQATVRRNSSILAARWAIFSATRSGWVSIPGFRSRSWPLAKASRRWPRSGR